MPRLEPVTALATVILLYAFFGTIGSLHGKAVDLAPLDPFIPALTLSWKYVELVAALCLAVAGIGFFYMRD
jgi:hypothetical protein